MKNTSLKLYFKKTSLNKNTKNTGLERKICVKILEFLSVSSAFSPPILSDWVRVTDQNPQSCWIRYQNRSVRRSAGQGNSAIPLIFKPNFWAWWESFVHNTVPYLAALKVRMAGFWSRSSRLLTSPSCWINSLNSGFPLKENPHINRGDVVVGSLANIVWHRLYVVCPPKRSWSQFSL